jgi:hypothetical protein
LSFTWLASHKRLAISGAGPSAAANSGGGVADAGGQLMHHTVLHADHAAQWPGNPACRPGPNTSTGLPKRS